jgi:murein DD-endopeptidase MepM/ murein hydrolase activator NlpD
MYNITMVRTHIPSVIFNGFLVISGIFVLFTPPTDPTTTPTPSVSNALDTRSPLQTAAYANFIGLFGTAELHTTLEEPVAGFYERIVKKHFGIFITPDTSPVQNDRFTGYHTGVDAEFTDTTDEVPVYAITDGTIVFRGWAPGYGGLIVLRHRIDGKEVFALYGHMDPESFPPPTTTSVHRGDQIAILGEDHSHETDGVRKHIHFSIFTGEILDMRGYVQTEAELESWLNPLDFYPQ